MSKQIDYKVTLDRFLGKAGHLRPQLIILFLIHP
jgi:hypothetical protein